MSKIKYVQLEPAAFLTDVDFQMMTAEQRGVYCSIIFNLYANGGELKIQNKGDNPLAKNDNSDITLLCNCMKTGEEWLKVWERVKEKFIIKNGVLTHKRVTEELERAANYRQQRSLAGKKGMQHRYNNPPNTVITKGVITKESKVNNRGDFSLRKNPPVKSNEVADAFDEAGIGVEKLPDDHYSPENIKKRQEWSKDFKKPKYF